VLVLAIDAASVGNTLLSFCMPLLTLSVDTGETMLVTDSGAVLVVKLAAVTVDDPLPASSN
jgi:hypothetical protein